MGTCYSDGQSSGTVLPIGNTEIAVSGGAPPGAQVAPAPLAPGQPSIDNKIPADDGHSVTESGLLYWENKKTFDNLVAEAKKGNEASVKELLRSGANVNMTGMWGNTPLIAACQYGHESICNLLLGCESIDVNVKNEKGAAAILYASMEGLDAVCRKILLLGGSVPMDHAIIYNSRTDKSGPYSPLSAAITNGHVRVITELLKSGIDIDADVVDPMHKGNRSTDMVLTKPVMIACACNQPAVIKQLVGLGADISCVEPSRRFTVLHHACRTKQSAASVIPLLLALVSINAGAEPKSGVIDIQSLAGDTALLLACEVSCEPAVVLLLEAGASAQVENAAGTSPLHHAVKKRSEGIVKLLLEANADPSLTDKKGVSPWDIAKKYRDDSKIKSMILDVIGRADGTKISGERQSPGRNLQLEECADVAVLPLVPSSAAFLTRDMLTGYSKSLDEMSNASEISKDLEIVDDEGDGINIQLNSQDCNADVTPFKEDTLRTASSATTGGSKGQSVKSSGAPMKASSHDRVSSTRNKTEALSAVRIGPADLFRE